MVGKLSLGWDGCQAPNLVLINANPVDGLGKSNAKESICSADVVPSSLCSKDSHQFYFVAWGEVSEPIARPARTSLSTLGPSLMLMGGWL